MNERRYKTRSIDKPKGRSRTDFNYLDRVSDKEIAAQFVFVDHGVDSVAGVAKSFDGSDLSEFGGAGERIEDQQIHGVNDRNGSDGVAEAPASHGKTFRKTIDDDRALGHSGKKPDGLVIVVKKNARIDFVGKNPQVVLYRESSDAFECVIVEDRAGRIVRRIENEDAGLVGDFRGDLPEIGLKSVFFDQSEGNGFRAETTRERWVDGKTGIRIQDFVAGFDERHHSQRQCHFAAGSYEDLFRLNGKISGTREIVRDLFAKRGNAAGSAVAVTSRSHGIAERVHHRSGGMKIGFAEFEMDDRAALAFKFLGARKDRERALSV